jgi:hypothetical protein
VATNNFSTKSKEIQPKNNGKMPKDKEFLLRFRITGKKSQPSKAPKLRGRTGSNNLKMVCVPNLKSLSKSYHRKFDKNPLSCQTYYEHRTPRPDPQKRTAKQPSSVYMPLYYSFFFLLFLVAVLSKVISPLPLGLPARSRFGEGRGEGQGEG